MRALLRRTASIALLLISAACGPGATNIRYGGESVSPDGELMASFYEFSGGGAAGFVVEVISVRRSENEFSPDEGVVLRMGNTQFVCLEWPAPDRLKVWASGFLLDQESAGEVPELEIKFEGRFDNAAALEDGCRGDFLRIRRR